MGEQQQEQQQYEAIVCLRTGGRGTIAAGARIDLCSICKHGIWVAPSSERHVKAGVPPVCLECSGASQQQAAAQYLKQATPEQIEELRFNFRDDPEMLSRLEIELKAAKG